MSRYYFHFRNGAWRVDPDGQELADLEAARLKAHQIARDLTQEGEPARAVIVVTDGQQSLFEISLGASR